MKINSGYSIGSNHQVSTFVLDGLIEVQDVSSVLTSLKFSAHNLASIYSLDKDCGINIDFKKWFEVLDKEKKLLLAYEALKMIRSFVGCEFSLDEFEELTVYFDKEDTKEKQIDCMTKVLTDFDYEAKKVVDRMFKKSHESGWHYHPVSKNLHSFEEASDIKVVLSNKATSDIFSLISEHLNKHLNNAENEIDERMKRYGRFLVLFEKTQTEEFFSKIIDMLFNIEEGKEPEDYDVKGLSSLIGEYLKIESVNVW